MCLPSPTTALARLEVLLPWLNGDLDTDVYGRNTRPESVEVETDYAEIRRVIDEFISSFDGSAGAGYLEVVSPRRPSYLKRVQPPTDEDLHELEAALRLLLEQGFGDTTLTDLSIPIGSLRVSVRSAGRKRPRRREGVRRGLVAGGVSALRDYRAAGAYVLQVAGATVELVAFLVAHLLIQPHMVAVRRCHREHCRHFVITATAARGRPRMFCSDLCRVWNVEQMRREARKKKQPRA